jgi:hypothetical protein
VDGGLLSRMAFTRHAVERFGERAALPPHYTPGKVEGIMRDLLLREGRVVVERPHWARSRKEADRYLQVGEWMLFLCQRSWRDSEDYDVVTVVNGSAENTWELASERGYLATPPPLRARAPEWQWPGWGDSIRQAWAQRGARSIGFVWAVREIHRARTELLAWKYECARQAFEEEVREYQKQREAARESHLRRYKAS